MSFLTELSLKKASVTLMIAAILTAAQKVFAAHGFDAGTIRQIAIEAGVAEGLIGPFRQRKMGLEKIEQPPIQFIHRRASFPPP